MPVALNLLHFVQAYAMPKINTRTDRAEIIGTQLIQERWRQKACGQLFRQWRPERQFC